MGTTSGDILDEPIISSTIPQKDYSQMMLKISTQHHKYSFPRYGYHHVSYNSKGIHTKHITKGD